MPHIISIYASIHLHSNKMSFILNNACRMQSFVISFLDPKTNLEVKNIDYSFKVTYSSSKMAIKDVKNQKTPAGIGVQIVKFPISGPINISIRMRDPINSIKLRMGISIITMTI